MQSRPFPHLSQFFRTALGRMILGIGILILICVVIVAYFLSKQQPQACQGTACTTHDNTPVKHPADSATVNPAEKKAEEKKKEEEQKKTEEKKRVVTPPPATPSRGGSSITPPSNDGGNTPPPPPGDGGNTGQSCPAYPAFPTDACTGVPAGVSLATTTGNFTTTSNGQVIDGRLITGDLVVDHDNVTITNSRIKGRVIHNGRTGLKLRDVDLGPDSCPGSTNGGARLIAGADYTLTRVHLHSNGADLLSLYGGGTILIQDSLFNNACYYSSDHLDAVQLYDPGSVANVTLLHNSIDIRPVNTGGFGNSAIFWADFPGSGSRLNIYNNYLSGGNYTLYALDAHASSGVVIDVSGNRFLRNAYNYGPCALSNSVPFNGTSGVKWANNAFSDGATITIDDC